MTIEATLERIAAALERQAAAMEAPMAAAVAAVQQRLAEPTQAPAAAQTEKRGPGRPPKAAAPAPAPAPEPTPEPAPAPADDDFLNDDPAPVVEVLPTLDDVRKALVAYGQLPGRSQEKARAVLKQYGHVDTLKALKPEHFKAVIDAAKA